MATSLSRILLSVEKSAQFLSTGVEKRRTYALPVMRGRRGVRAVRTSPGSVSAVRTGLCSTRPRRLALGSANQGSLLPEIRRLLVRDATWSRNREVNAWIVLILAANVPFVLLGTI